MKLTTAAVLAAVAVSSACAPTQSWDHVPPVRADCAGATVQATAATWEAGPRDAIQFPDGLTICITDVAMVQSPSSAEGMLTVVTLRVENRGDGTLRPRSVTGSVVNSAEADKDYPSIATGRIPPRESYEPGSESMVRVAFTVPQTAWATSRLQLTTYAEDNYSKAQHVATFTPLS